jgi:hypothetical protein
MTTEKFTLYEIDQAYQAAQDRADEYAAEHGGEMLPEHDMALTALEMTRDMKIETTIKFYKNQIALADMVESELEALKNRAKAHRNAAERVKSFLAQILRAGEKPEFGAGKVSWRESSRVIVDNTDLVPKEYIKVETSIKVQEIKNAIKSGEVFDFAHVEKFQNISIK